MAKVAARVSAARTLQAGLAEEVQQRGLILVDGREARFDSLQAGLEDELHDALLLVAEERLDGVVRRPEVAVEAANDLGEIGADDRGACGPGEFLVEAFFFGLVTLDRGGDVLVAEVDHGEDHGFLLVGDL